MCIHLNQCCKKSLPLCVQSHHDTCGRSITRQLRTNQQVLTRFYISTLRRPAPSQQPTFDISHLSELEPKEITQDHTKITTMSNLANLASSLQHMGLQQKDIDYHELKIEYPVLDLLPEDTPVEATLVTPACTGFRERPESSKYLLDLSGSDYIIRVPLTRDGPLPLMPSELHGVFATLVRLLTVHGRSLLQIATYFDPEQGDMYRFRLSTERHDGQAEVAGEAELNSEVWEAEKYSFRRETWMILIRGLLIRYTDRAYWHVHEKLKGFRWYLKQIADEDWDWEDGFDAKRFFNKHYMYRLQSGVAGDTDSDDDEFFLTMPCSHTKSLSGRQLKTMSADECLRLRCILCGQPVVRAHFRFRAWIFLQREREARTRFSTMQMNWQRLNEEWRGCQEISIRADTLHEALRHAMLSIRPPESVSPRSLHVSSCEEFLKIVNILRGQLGGSDEDINCTSASLFDGLMDKLDKAVGLVDASGHESGNLERLPSTWRAMAHLWLMRTVQLVSIPGLGGFASVELFEDEFAENENRAEGDAEIRELEAMLKDARLE